MCASYAWENQKTGFCIVGGQCFTSDRNSTDIDSMDNSTDIDYMDDGFLEAFNAAEQVPCNTPGAMTCYTFGSQTQGRRSKSRYAAAKRMTGTARRQTLMTVVSFLAFPGVNLHSHA
jgi:hypothetical protein